MWKLKESKIQLSQEWIIGHIKKQNKLTIRPCSIVFCPLIHPEVF
jgi:hypothetical protein